MVGVAVPPYWVTGTCGAVARLTSSIRSDLRRLDLGTVGYGVTQQTPSRWRVILTSAHDKGDGE